VHMEKDRIRKNRTDQAHWRQVQNFLLDIKQNLVGVRGTTAAGRKKGRGEHRICVFADGVAVDCADRGGWTKAMRRFGLGSEKGFGSGGRGHCGAGRENSS